VASKVEAARAAYVEAAHAEIEAVCEAAEADDTAAHLTQSHAMAQGRRAQRCFEVYLKTIERERE
jgi:hypothetical protein